MADSSQPLSLQDFERCSWQDVIAHSGEHECYKYAPHFQRKMMEAEAAQDATAQEVFLLLATITSLAFELDTPVAPFAPSTFVDSLGEGVLDILHALASTITDADMRARIADLLWVRVHNHHMAQVAVDSYLESARILEDPSHWVACATRLERALQVAAQFNMRKKAYNTVIALIENVLARLDGDDPLFLSSKLMELLQSQKEGDPAKYGALAEKAARRALAAKEWHIATTYWAVLAAWHKQADDLIAERTAWREVAETYVTWSESFVESSTPSYLGATTQLQAAIEIYRNHVGKAQAQGRIEELHKRLLLYGRRASQEMRRASASVEVTHLVESAQQQVKGKPLSEALQALAFLGSGEIPQHVPDLRKRVEELAQRFPLRHLFASTLMTSDGRVAARNPSALSSDKEEVEKALRNEMCEQARWVQSLHAQAHVEPARFQILLEHHVRIQDFAPIVTHNPFVPSGREHTYARGLYAGITGDLLVAGHLLIPQLENSVRTLLERQGKITSNLTTAGVQSMYTLSKIFEQHFEEVAAIMGTDLAFDLQGLLVDEFGFNLRNDVSHGLLDDSGLTSAPMLYLWWLTLHICYRFKLAVDEQHAGDRR